jgi:ribosomal protein S18 acetylase RimI-like enzyme
MKMVSADIQHSTQSGGLFCVIEDDTGSQIGILDFIPGYANRTAFLSLLMISREHRNKGYGKAVVEALESYLIRNHKTDLIESGVQTNNEPGIRFWRNRGFEIGQTAKALDDGTVAFEMKKEIANST